MTGDISSLNRQPARQIIELLDDTIAQSDGVWTMSVGGESGSGKSTLALALEKVLAEKGYVPFIFHMDDYFKLPPDDNHRQRATDLSHVGPEEVNLPLLQQHIDEIKQGARQISKPRLAYGENKFTEVSARVAETDIIIAEGTYCTLLEQIDCKIFLLRNYKETYPDRLKRGRDPIIPFTEEVLQIEHKILQDHIPLADLLVDKEYRIHPQ